MDTVKQAVCAAIDARREELIAVGEDILRHPELGYRETRTSGVVEREFGRLGLTDVSHPALTGVKGWLRNVHNVHNDPPDGACTSMEQPVSVAVMGELDAVLSPGHPYADPTTGAAHACGHNAQIAAMLGCAWGMLAVREELDGDICFLATPAEEYCELEYRAGLREKGKIRYLGGKQQMIAEGAFDDIGMAMMVHSETNAGGAHVVTGGWSTGFIGKTVRFTGKEAHAGGAPWEGVNALNAATLAIQAIHCQRETFRDSDHVRVHPILTKGGDLVNTVPADVRMESYVRAGSVEAMREANAKVNRAIRGAAYAVGAEADIRDMPGYLPLSQNAALGRLFAANLPELVPNALAEEGLPFCGSTDAGDLSCLLPLIQPTVSGFAGALHSREFRITDPELAYILPAKLMACTVVDLLRGGAKAARAILSIPHRCSMQDFFSVWEAILA